MTQAGSLAKSESLLPTPSGYVEQATLPLPSLILLLPLIIIYEVGTQYLTTAARNGQEQQIIAFSKMVDFFRLFGATRRHMPAMAVGGMLLGWHIARHDTWKVNFRVVLGMAAESIVLGLPLLLLAFTVNRFFPVLGLQATTDALTSQSSVGDRLIMDLGAGVYEEFVFRLVLFTFFSFLLKDLLKMRDLHVYLLMVVISAILFAAYHYWSPTEHFAARIFAFRTLAGIYFGAIFLCRGFGITAGSHCAYDVIITLC
jgi:membrane protease YdiL (CAAX protease family)